MFGSKAHHIVIKKATLCVPQKNGNRNWGGLAYYALHGKPPKSIELARGRAVLTKLPRRASRSHVSSARVGRRRCLGARRGEPPLQRASHQLLSAVACEPVPR